MPGIPTPSQEIAMSWGLEVVHTFDSAAPALSGYWPHFDVYTKTQGGRRYSPSAGQSTIHSQVSVQQLF